MSKVNLKDNENQWELDAFIDTLMNEAGYSYEEVSNMEPRDLVDAWLQWNGMLGWTDDIIALVRCAYNLKFDTY